MQVAESLYLAAMEAHSDMRANGCPDVYATLLEYEALITRHNFGKLLQVCGALPVESSQSVNLSP